MATAAMFTRQNAIHGEFVGAFFLNENGGVTIRAGQPFSVRGVRKFHPRHLVSVFKHDVHVEHGHLTLAFQIGAGFDNAEVYGLDPINAAAAIQRKGAKGFGGFLQCVDGGIFRVVDAIGRQCFGFDFIGKKAIIAPALAFAAEDWDSLTGEAFPTPRTLDDLHNDPEFQALAGDAVIAAIPLQVSVGEAA